MIFGGRHRGWRRDLLEDALGFLAPDRGDALHRHLEHCPRCRDEHAAVQRTLAATVLDPARQAEPPLDVRVFEERVQRAIDRRRMRPIRRPSTYWKPALIAAAGLLVVATLVRRPPLATPEAHISEEALGRMEREVGREQTARYLQEAQGVLLSVTATLPQCGPSAGRRVAAEVEKGRELLARRLLLVDGNAEHLASVRPVLEDVDHVLGEVSVLEQCAPPAALRSIAQRIAEEHLLMKIDLLTRELQG